jgi:superfamily II DNA or RNA helicase
MQRMADQERLAVRVATAADPLVYGIDDLALITDRDGCDIAMTVLNGGRGVELFFSWDDTAPRVLIKSERFESAWANRLPGVDTVSPGGDLAALLVHPQDAAVVGRPDSSATARRAVGMPADIALRPYQEHALDSWWRGGGRGVMSMATGTGKTFVALAGLVRCATTTPGPLAIVIVTPFVHLVDQWAELAREWGFSPVRCYESSRSWEPAAWEAADAASLVGRAACLITTPQTASLPVFARLLDRLQALPSALIADEVHHLGSPAFSRVLDERYDWRMGLSATPIRWGDPDGTATILDFFGGVVVEFGIADAIAGGFLSPYTYEPVLVDLLPDELAEYRAIVRRLDDIGRGPSRRHLEDLEEILDRRSAVLNGALGKTAALREKIAQYGIDHALIYCASRLQMGAVSDILRDAGHLPRPFTAEEDRATRAELLSRFASGHVPALVAMRALDEGVDVPAIRQAHLLASSGNPTQFIQRRGRVLRPAPGKDLARLIDYVALPDSEGEFEHELARREMTRVLEFASTSIDPGTAHAAMAPILERLELDGAEAGRWA